MSQPLTLEDAQLALVARYGAVIGYAHDTATQCGVTLRIVDLWTGHVRLGFRSGRITQDVVVAGALVQNTPHWQHLIDNAVVKVSAASKGDAGLMR